MTNNVTVFLSTEHKTVEMEHLLNSNLFPTKLWRMVNNSEINAIIWNDQGDGIIINKRLIEKEFLSSNGFKASTYASFERQLNSYGFKKSQRFNKETPNIFHFSHPNLRKNQPELLPLLRRCVKKSHPIVKFDFQKNLMERWRNHRKLDDAEDDVHIGES